MINGNNSRVLMAGVVALGLMGAGATQADDGKAATLKQLNETSQAWRLPSTPQALPFHAVIDSQPETRALAGDRLVNRLGYSLNQVARADRLHIGFRSASYRLTDQEQAAIGALVAHANERDWLVVTGYSGNLDDSVQGLELAKRRAAAVAKVARSHNRYVMIREDATAHWGGNPDQAQRAEIFFIPSVESRSIEPNTSLPAPVSSPAESDESLRWLQKP